MKKIELKKIEGCFGEVPDDFGGMSVDARLDSYRESSRRDAKEIARHMRKIANLKAVVKAMATDLKLHVENCSIRQCGRCKELSARDQTEAWRLDAKELRAENERLKLFLPDKFTPNQGELMIRISTREAENERLNAELRLVNLAGADMDETIKDLQSALAEKNAALDTYEFSGYQGRCIACGERISHKSSCWHQKARKAGE